jgi:Zn-dependent peptidase ImmA (M78 family)
VRYQPTNDDLSGFLYQDQKSNIAIIGVNSNHPPNRKNFTIAHELGHYLLHDVDEIHVDRQFKVRLRSKASSEGFDVAEKEANLFAAELLMPAHLLEEDIEEVDVMDLDDESFIQEMANRYGVSAQAMTFRLAYLGHVQL